MLETLLHQAANLTNLTFDSRYPNGMEDGPPPQAISVSYICHCSGHSGRMRGGAGVLAFASNTAWAQASKERVAHLFEESLRICLSCRDSPDMRRQPSRKQASELKVLMESGIRSAQRTPAALTLLRYLRVCAGATPSISVRIRGKAARAAPTIVRCAHR